MKLVELGVENFRSIKKLENFRVEPLQALVGENNSGKSNILRSIECFLSSGSAGVKPEDFHDRKSAMKIEVKFGGLNDQERRRLRPYLLDGHLTFQKKLSVDPDQGKVASEYHGYKAEPKDWWLSVEKILEEKGARPKWDEIAEENGIIEYVRLEGGRVNKESYKKGVEKFLQEHDHVEYDEPKLCDAKAFGFQQVLLADLPKFFLLPAISDYSDEIDRRSSSTVFRRLMANLIDRIMTSDPGYEKIGKTFAELHQLLNPPAEDDQDRRPHSLREVETTLRDTVGRLMPGVRDVQMTVQIDQAKDVFSKGVALKVDDGVLTDVLLKGHGMQRSIIFSLLQMLMKSAGTGEDSPIILAIEEPELYIHPHAQRRIYRVLKEFAGVLNGDDSAGDFDQVLYSTHSPRFVDVSQYERIAVVRKNPETGTETRQCEAGVLGIPEEEKGFQLLSSFDLKHNEMFFARHCILVEGREDEIGIIATLRKLKRIVDLPDEIGLSITPCGGKLNIPKFQKVLNAFGFSYGVLLELDGCKPESKQHSSIIENLNGNSVAEIPEKLEDLLGLSGHFSNQYHAKQFFSGPDNINREMEELVLKLLPLNLSED